MTAVLDTTLLSELAAQLRIDSIACSTAAGSGHPTSAMSAADVMAVLLTRHLRYDWAHPADARNDHMIFSKGHASPLLYAMFAAAADGALLIGDTRIVACAVRDPAALPWRELGVDLVFECTGVFTTRRQAASHLEAGARFVVLSAPAKSPDVPTVVHGVNRADGTAQVISCASCTTNCIAPVIEVAHRRIGVERAVMTTVHAYTAGQQLVDRPSRSFLRGRAAAANLVPTSTGGARATTRAVPELAGRFDGLAVRAPIPVGSLADIVFVAARPTSAEELNDVFREEAAGSRYAGILAVSDQPLVSSDIVGDPHAAIIDLSLTQVVDATLVKVMAWYDNEWGFSQQMVREARAITGTSLDRSQPIAGE